MKLAEHTDTHPHSHTHSHTHTHTHTQVEPVWVHSGQEIFHYDTNVAFVNQVLLLLSLLLPLLSSSAHSCSLLSVLCSLFSPVLSCSILLYILLLSLVSPALSSSLLLSPARSCSLLLSALSCSLLASLSFLQLYLRLSCSIMLYRTLSYSIVQVLRPMIEAHRRELARIYKDKWAQKMHLILTLAGGSPARISALQVSPPPMWFLLCVGGVCRYAGRGNLLTNLYP
jgi:hypothetical protein